MQLHGGTAVFELVGFLDRGEGQLAFLADGHKPHPQFIGHHSTQNEAPRIQPCDHIRSQGRIHVAMHECVDQHTKHARVLQQGRDVAKLHARSWPVGHGADVVAQEFVNIQSGHGFTP
jgi:hypothetical protein